MGILNDLQYIEIEDFGHIAQPPNCAFYFYFSERQDFTVFGGSLSGAHAQKICKVSLCMSVTNAKSGEK